MSDEEIGANTRKRKPLALPELIDDIDLRFTSSNGIPVSRAAIRPEEWRLLREAISRSRT